MPDLDLMPSGRTIDPGEAPPLDSVLRLARRRRRVRATVVGTLAGGVAIVAVLLAVPGPSTGSLKTVTPAVQPTSPAGRQQASQPPTPAAHPGIGAAGRSTVTGSTVAGRGAATVPTSQAGSGVASGARPEPSVGPPHRMAAYDASRACDGSGPTAAFGWCSYYTGATSGTAGGSVLIATDVCRLPGQSAGRLTSDTGQQAEFSVAKKAYPPVWTWSRDRRFTPTSTSVVVAAGECVEWFVTWRVVDDRGRPLPSGTYELDATPLAAPDGDNGALVYNPQSFTVTG